MVKIKKSVTTMLVALAVAGLFGCSKPQADTHEYQEVAEKFAIEYVTADNSKLTNVINKYCTENLATNYLPPEEDAGDGSAPDLQVKAIIQDIGVESVNENTVSYVINVQKTVGKDVFYIPLSVKVNQDKKVSELGLFTNKINVIG